MTTLTINVPESKAVHLLDVLQHLTYATVETVQEDPPQEKPKRKQKRFPKNPENPSPSGDPWFDDPRNLAVVTEAVREHKEGKSKSVPLDDPELQAIFAWSRER